MSAKQLQLVNSRRQTKSWCSRSRDSSGGSSPMQVKMHAFSLQFGLRRASKKRLRMSETCHCHCHRFHYALFKKQALASAFDFHFLEENKITHSSPVLVPEFFGLQSTWSWGLYIHRALPPVNIFLSFF